MEDLEKRVRALEEKANQEWIKEVIEDEMWHIKNRQNGGLHFKSKMELYWENLRMQQEALTDWLKEDE